MDTVTLDGYTFAVLLISILVLGIMLGIVGAPFHPTSNRKQTAADALRDAAIDRYEKLVWKYNDAVDRIEHLTRERDKWRTRAVAEMTDGQVAPVLSDGENSHRWSRL